MASPSEMKAAVVVAEAVRPVASAPQARLPAEEAAVASGAKAQPLEAAEVLPGPSARQPVAAEEAEEASGAEAQPPVGAEAVSGAAAVQPPEAAGVALDAAAEPQQAVAAAGQPDAEALRPGVAEQPAPWVRRPAAERPSAPPSWRPGGPRPWLARRQAERSAHAMRRSRAASPSRQSWRAAGCEGLS
jgi:DNA polymerase-3 subunit gamma/tau